VVSYVFWNYHEDVKGQMDWETESRNLRQFLQAAQDEGLFINLRIGPYVCAEWYYGTRQHHTNTPTRCQHYKASLLHHPHLTLAPLLMWMCGVGGLPLWLRDDPSIQFRYYDPLWLEPVGAFIRYVTKYVEVSPINNSRSSEASLCLIMGHSLPFLLCCAVLALPRTQWRADHLGSDRERVR
jgi:hypothetical protein